MITRVVVALAAGLGLAVGATTAPVAADPTPQRCDGVTVVVDYNELGGRTRTDCVAPGTAAETFHAAGVGLEYLPQLAGFVCRVDEKPADGPCSDGDAYWSLWWSDGSSPWTYASLGVDALEIPDGGTVGFAWHEGSGDAQPPDDLRLGIAEPAHVSDDPNDAPAAEDAAAETSDDEGLPAWVIGLVALGVLAAALVPLVRRRRS